MTSKVAVLVSLVSASIMLGLGMVTWTSATYHPTLAVASTQSTAVVSASGRELVPLLPAAAFVVASAGAALSIAGTIARRVIGVVLALAGTTTAVACLVVGLDPVTAILPVVADHNGSQIDASSGQVAAGSAWLAWPTAMVSAIVLIQGVVVTAGRLGLAAKTSRFDRREAEAPTSEDANNAQMWDALDHGHDPTT